MHWRSRPQFPGPVVSGGGRSLPGGDPFLVERGPVLARGCRSSWSAEIMAPPLSPVHDWESVGEPTAESLTYSSAGGTECGTEYEFRVRSYGDAATYAAGWGPDSDASSVTTAACSP